MVLDLDNFMNKFNLVGNWFITRDTTGRPVW